MPVEEGLPWHPVAMGLAGQAIPCVVAAPPPPPGARSPIPSILVPCSRCPGCLSCLAAPLLLVCCTCPHPSWCGSHVLCGCVAPLPVRWRSWVPLVRTHSCPTHLPPNTTISRLRTTLMPPPPPTPRKMATDLHMPWHDLAHVCCPEFCHSKVRLLITPHRMEKCGVLVTDGKHTLAQQASSASSVAPQAPFGSAVTSSTAGGWHSADGGWRSTGGG